MTARLETIDWFQHEYPKLKLLQFLRIYAFNHRKHVLVRSFNAFFNQNPNVKVFETCVPEMIQIMKNGQLSMRIWEGNEKAFDKFPVRLTLKKVKRRRKIECQKDVSDSELLLKIFYFSEKKY